MSLADARKQIFLLDSRGLIVASRADPEKGDPCRGGKRMAHHKVSATFHLSISPSPLSLLSLSLSR